MACDKQDTRTVKYRKNGSKNEGTPQVANDTLSATAKLIGTIDSKGITMRPEALREATQKAAKTEALGKTKGDPMAPKKLCKHDKRTAVVSAV